ncbi:biogenesis of lysosome-related organelles complex 1 subunit 5 [Parasteatoda tepidariorum]|uniref:biogenesis of lysosome-related organelles complex 1 subunit 5 n=1 Tax=Parasteatoda tepidariorum TaxID=114398 RepID=UPI001C723A39|nr:biogenesis of lysosome-related organelles complex 1 subunit 5 [Parasteatoda tepidariorum]
MSEGNVLERVMKDIGDVESRLFDHRPFVQGETKFFLKEFEEKRKEREVRRMFEMLEIVTEIKETQIEKGVKLGDMHLCNLTGHFEVALRMCNNIVEREDSNKKKDFLDRRREQRKKEWIAFVDDIQNKNTAVNQTFADKEEQLKTYYNKLEEAMHISPTQSDNSI